jgi:hypothetical protein
MLQAADADALFCDFVPARRAYKEISFEAMP